jgi:sugar-specific transcriptional regulator TrmB
MEARIYTFLCQEAPATGYRVAQAIGKPVANTYKAIEVLARKGAVLVDDGENRMCRAVPIDEILTRLERDFRESSVRTARAFEGLEKPADDERVYQLRSREQILERARQMLAGAQKVALAALFPEPARLLKADLEAAAKRVDVAVKVYQEIEVKGAEVVLSSQPFDDARAFWPGQELNLVVDGEQHMLALLDHDPPGVVQAVWSRSTYLSLGVHNGMAVELGFTTLSRELLSGASQRTMRKTLERLRHPRDTPGYELFMQRMKSAAQKAS